MSNLVSTPLDETFVYDQACAYDTNMKVWNNEAQMFLVSGADKGRETYTDEFMDYITASREGYEAEGSIDMPEETMKVSATYIRQVIASKPLNEAVEILKDVLPAVVAEYMLANPYCVEEIQRKEN